MKKDSVLKSMTIIFLYYVVFELFQYIYIVLDLDGAIDATIFLIIDSLICLIGLAFMLKDKLKGQWTEFKKDFKNKIKKTVKYFLIGLGLMLLVNLIINVLILKELPPNEQANREILNARPLFSIIYMCIMAPLSEELLFRLNFKDVFKKKWGYVLATGIFFGALHVLSGEPSWTMLVYLVPYSILGMTFSYIFFETDNIYSSILAHMFNNAFAVATILLGI